MIALIVVLCDSQSARFRPTYVTTYEIVALQCTLCLIKKIPDIFNRNSNTRRWILVIFGRNVSHKVGNGQMHNFLTRLTKWKRCYSVFAVLQGNAETLIGRGEKLYHLSIACLSQKHSCEKKLLKSNDIQTLLESDLKMSGIFLWYTVQ